MNSFYFYLSNILNPLLNPLNFLFIVLIIILIYFYKLKSKAIYNLLIINLSIILLISFLPIGKLGLNYLENDFKNPKPNQAIKNILVLSGSDTRIIASIELSKNYLHSKIYYIGANSYPEKQDPLYDHSRVRTFYENMNFEMDRLYFVGNSRNTIENFDDIKKLNIIGSETILLTSAYHMKRSMLIASKKNLDLLPYAIDFTPEVKKSLMSIYKSFNVVNNMNKFNLFIREIIGILAVKILY